MADPRLNIGVSADAKQAAATFKALSEDIKEVGKQSVGVTDSFNRTQAAIEKLSRAPDTPIALAKAVAKAKLEVDDLRAALDKTPVSAERMKAISAALEQAESAMQGAIERAGKLKESQEEVAQQMGLTAKGAESLGNSFGSLDGVLGKMADSSSKASQNVAKVAFSVLAAGQAFKLGYEAGESFRKGLEAIGVTLPDLSDKAGALVLTIESMVRGYEKAELVESAAMNRARQIIALREAQAKSELALAKAIAASGVEWKSADAEREKVMQKINAIEQILSRASKSEEAYRKTIAQNAPVLAEVAEQANRYGIALGAVAPRTSAAAKAAEEFIAKQKEMAAAVPEATAAVSAQQEQMAMGEAEIKRAADAYQYYIDKQAQWISQTDRVEAGMRQWKESTQGAGSAFGALSGDFTQINGAVESFLARGGQLQNLMVGMAEVSMTWKKSTEEMNRALEAQLALLGRLDEKMVGTLDKFEQWRSAMAYAVDALDKGTMSVPAFIEAMNQLATQLSQNFGAAAGEAGDEVRRLIAAIQALIAQATVGGGTNIDPTLWGGLEREFGRK